MGKRSHIVIMLALLGVLMVLLFSWYIGLQQAYTQQREALKTFIELIDLPQNQLNQDQQTQLAQKNHIQLYQIFRSKDELISIRPNTDNLNKSLILQALKQEDGFIPSNDQDSIFYKHKIDEKSIHLASISLVDVRSQYINNTQYKVLLLTIAISIFFGVLILWQNRYAARKKASTLKPVQR